MTAALRKKSRHKHQHFFIYFSSHLKILENSVSYPAQTSELLSIGNCLRLPATNDRTLFGKKQEDSVCKLI
jgi:hypothetical protein